jgi:hypothetical protein
MNRLVRFSILTLAIGFTLMIAQNASATNYYISTSGSDSNSGTSESNPWAHLPGMPTYTGGHTPVAGDTFTLRGCDDWGNSNFPINWTYSGTSNSLINVTVDKTWFNSAVCPSGWNRPIFDAQKAVISSAGAECGGPVHNVFIINTGSYTTFAWIEAKGLAWAGGCGNSGIGYMNGTPSNDTYDNWYIHSFYPTTGNSSDSSNAFWVQYPGGACGVEATPNCTLSNTVINDCDVQGTGQVQYGGGLGGFNSIGNIFTCVAGAIKTYGGGILAYNNIQRVAEVPNGGHPNCIETLAAVTTGVIYYIHDNYIQETTGGGCEGGQVGNPGEADYMWNNVWYMVGSGANQPQVPQSDGANWSLYFWNNTSYVAAGCISTGVHGTGIVNFYAQNNHCINDNGYTVNGNTGSGNAPLVPTGASGVSNNLNMTTATAATQGYSTTNNFAPTSASDSTVGAGTSLSTLLNTTWPGQISGTNTTTLEASNPVGTNGACAQQSVSGVVESVCPTLTPTVRGGSWDIGAYEWGSGSAGAPNPPTGLLATVQ